MFYHSFRSEIARFALGCVIFTLALGCSFVFSNTVSLHAEESSQTSESSAPEQTTQDPDESSSSTADESTPDGSDGTDVGNNTGGTESEATDTASIATGNASSSADTETRQNTNDTSVSGATEGEVSHENDATASTTANVQSSTGDNTAVAGTNAIITTGYAISTANILNVVNTNVFNARGLMYFLNMIMGNIAFDLRSLFAVLTGDRPTLEAGSTCSIEDGTCTGGNTSLTLSNTNNAVVENDLTVGATTGANASVAGTGDASVTSGDAYAGANIMNVVNTNITNANYLLLTMNGFGGGNGDIVFPGADWFYELLGGGATVRAGSNVTYDNTNVADVSTIGSTVADSGNNEATGAQADMTTGDADASTNIVDRVNTTIFGDSISLLFRVSGNWGGNVYGLPDGMNWRETASGIEIFWEGLPGEGGAPITDFDELSVTNDNTAEVRNRFNVYALTGENMADAGDEASIATGDAQASTNVVNVVNTNVLGRNWVLAIFNILGDWNGNITFGRPDLWVGARAITPPTVRPGTCFSYEVTINNFGDATARNTYLIGRHNTLFQRIDGMVEDAEGRLRYHVGRIPAGGSKTVTLPACVSELVGAGTPIETDFTVESDEPDADATNNTDMISVLTRSGGGGGSLLRGTTAHKNGLSIVKTANTDTITASSSVEYTITVTNTGDPMYHTLLLDTIFNEAGDEIYEQRWSLEKIAKDETVIVRYTAFFSSSTVPGVYTNKAFISASTGEDLSSKPVESPTASFPVTVKSAVTVAEEPAVCDALLTDYLRFDRSNDPAEVSKLQMFLRAREDATSVSISGIFDRPTFDAVHAFQRKYASEILEPWGMTQSTGYVYFTTQKKVNEIWCGREFPLNTDQTQEIATIRSVVNTAQERGEPVPNETFERIGAAPVIKEEDTTVAMAEALQEAVRKIDVTEESVPAVTESPLMETQVAATGGLWSSIRERVSSIFSFFK